MAWKMASVWKRRATSALPALAACRRAMIAATRAAVCVWTIEQHPLPHRIVFRIEKAHRKNALLRIAGDRRRYGVGTVSGGKIDPRPLVRVPFDGRLPVLSDLELRQGAFDAKGSIGQIDAPDIGGDATGKRRPDRVVARLHETLAAQEVTQTRSGRGGDHRARLGASAAIPAKDAPDCSSMRSSWLYLATVLEVRSEPILI